MFPDKQKTYPGRKIIQAVQVGLVFAIGVFGIMSLTRPRTVDTAPSFEPRATTVPMATLAPTTIATLMPDNSAEMFYQRGRAMHDVDDHESAIELYTQAIELDPSMVNAWLSRGVAYEQSGADERLSRNDLWRYVQRMETERIEREITPNETLELEMTEGLVYALTFEAHKGDTLEVAASSVVKGEHDEEGVVDPLILLFDSQDLLVRGDDDTIRPNGTLLSMNSRIDNYRVLSDGTYTLILTHAGGGSYGMTDITVSVR